MPRPRFPGSGHRTHSTFLLSLGLPSLLMPMTPPWPRAALSGVGATSSPRLKWKPNWIFACPSGASTFEALIEVEAKSDLLHATRGLQLSRLWLNRKPTLIFCRTLGSFNFSRLWLRLTPKLTLAGQSGFACQACPAANSAAAHVAPSPPSPLAADRQHPFGLIGARIQRVRSVGLLKSPGR